GGGDHDGSRVAVAESFDVEGFLAGQTKAGGILPVHKLQRQDPHANQVRSVDALIADGDNGFHAEQQRAFGGPVSRRARTVFGAGDDYQWSSLLLVSQ